MLLTAFILLAVGVVLLTFNRPGGLAVFAAGIALLLIALLVPASTYR